VLGSLDEEERARIEKGNNHTLIIVDMPNITKNEKNHEHLIMNQFIHKK
jgi:hypothetical protein